MQKITRNLYFRFEKYVPKLMKPIPTYHIKCTKKEYKFYRSFNNFYLNDFDLGVA